ncbi:MAG: hypothetical protein II874_03900 [Bacteroidales bacterium]|nr:hypothetical protein [Bacteroidales bacterium]
MEQEVQIINSSEALEALNRSDIDIQVQTAMRYPKHSTPDQINFALVKAESFALVDSETAESCFYRLEREDKKTGQKSIIEGPSIRLAEIIANSWGNIRIATRIVGNDGKFITAQGACHDLESNVIQVVEVKRSICTSKGFTFSADMQVVTGNAAASIARRNAILAVIPQAIFKNLYAKIKTKAIGDVQNNLENRRAKMLKTYALAGVNSEMLCKHLGVQAVDDITAEMVVNLASLWNALRDGQTTIEETFKKPAAEAAAAQKVREKNAAAKDRIAASAAGARAKTSTAPVPAEEDLPPAPGEIDPETGEVIQQG